MPFIMMYERCRDCNFYWYNFALYYHLKIKWWGGTLLPNDHVLAFHCPKPSVTWLDIRPPYVISLNLSLLSLINETHIVIARKGNKGRRLSWLRTMTNRRDVMTNNVSVRVMNCTLILMVIKLEQWEELLLDRVEHLRMTVWRRSPERKRAWDPLLIFWD